MKNRYSIHLFRENDKFISEFKDKEEFTLNIHYFSKGFANSGNAVIVLKEIVERSVQTNPEVIIVSTQNHKFTDNYNFKFLENVINRAIHYDCDILLGGCISFDHCVPIEKNLFWIDTFYGSNFIILFRSIFKKLTVSKFQLSYSLCNFLFRISDKVNIIYPQISENLIESENPEVCKFLERSSNLKIYHDKFLQFQRK